MSALAIVALLGVVILLGVAAMDWLDRGLDRGKRGK
jgi:hypothetical protein